MHGPGIGPVGQAQNFFEKPSWGLDSKHLKEALHSISLVASLIEKVQAEGGAVQTSKISVSPDLEQSGGKSVSSCR